MLTAVTCQPCRTAPLATCRILSAMSPTSSCPPPLCPSCQKHKVTAVAGVSGKRTKKHQRKVGACALCAGAGRVHGCRAAGKRGQGRSASGQLNRTRCLPPVAPPCLLQVSHAQKVEGKEAAALESAMQVGRGCGRPSRPAVLWREWGLSAGAT